MHKKFFGEEQTLVYTHPVGTGKKYRRLIKAGNQVDQINSGPTYSYGGSTYYLSARIITNRDKKSQWYQNVRFDSDGYGSLE